MEAGCLPDAKAPRKAPMLESLGHLCADRWWHRLGSIEANSDTHRNSVHRISGFTTQRPVMVVSARKIHLYPGLVRWGCCNKEQQTEWLGQTLTCSHSGGCKSKLKVWGDSALLPARVCSSLCPSIQEFLGLWQPGCKQSSQAILLVCVCVSVSPFYKGTNHIGLGHPYPSITSP